MFVCPGLFNSNKNSSLVCMPIMLDGKIIFWIPWPSKSESSINANVKGLRIFLVCLYLTELTSPALVVTFLKLGVLKVVNYVIFSISLEFFEDLLDLSAKTF